MTEPTPKPIPPRRILVGWDGWEAAEAALHQALDLAERHDAELQIVHGVTRRHLLLPEPTVDDVAEARRQVEVQLEGSLVGARLAPDGHPSELLVAACKHPAELILARSVDADLVVLGNHRRHGLLDMNDTVRGVLAGARVPVWIQVGPVRPLDRILVPVDLSDASLIALETAIGWARVHEARLTVLHCFHAPEPFTDEGYGLPGPSYVVDGLRQENQVAFEAAMAGVDWQGVEHQLRFVDDEPVARILRHQSAVDLVVMATHGHTGFHGALMGHVADLVLRHGHGPVLALREPDRSWLT